MQRINLYQDPLERHRDAFDARRLALSLFALVLVLAAVSGGQAWRADSAEAQAAAALAGRDATSARVEALQAQLDGQSSGDDRGRRLRQELAAKRALLSYLDEGPLGGRAGFSGYLDGLSRHIVDGVWLSRIGLADGGARLRLNGHAVAPDRVPQLIAALSEAPAFRGRTFRRLAIDRPEQAQWRVDFVLASGEGES